MPSNRLSLLIAAFTLSALACEPQAGPIDVVEASIAEIQDAILTGRTTCRMVVQAYLDRIEAYDESTVNAITVVNPNALSRADDLDALLGAGLEPPPLFCAPMLVKDNFDTHDLPTTGGSAALMGSLPPDDAFMVRRIREAGAVIVAKTNMAEWAFSARQTVSSSYDTTANAYAFDRVPAGSSGGTASGVAASFGVAGLGSDTGNSIRGPSSHLALVGIRSTIGLTSRDGVIPLSFDRDIAGPMARSVEDAATIFNVVAGYDPADPYTEAGRDRKEPDYTAGLDADGLQGTRIAVVRQLVDAEDANTAVVRVFEQAVADLAQLGATIVDPFAFRPTGAARSGRHVLQALPLRHVPVPIVPGRGRSDPRRARGARDGPVRRLLRAVPAAPRGYADGRAPQRLGHTLPRLLRAPGEASVSVGVGWRPWMQPKSTPSYTPAGGIPRHISIEHAQSTWGTTANSWRRRPECPPSRYRWGTRTERSLQDCRFSDAPTTSYCSSDWHMRTSRARITDGLRPASRPCEVEQDTHFGSRAASGKQCVHLNRGGAAPALRGRSNGGGAQARSR